MKSKTLGMVGTIGQQIHVDYHREKSLIFVARTPKISMSKISYIGLIFSGLNGTITSYNFYTTRYNDKNIECDQS